MLNWFDMLKNVCFPSAAAAIAATLLLSACATKTPAPVSDRRPPVTTNSTQMAGAVSSTTSPPSTKPAISADATATEAGKVHTVQKGETLYAIAFQNNIDYRELAIWNNIENLNVIKAGAVLRLTPPGSITPQPRPNEPVVTPLTVATMPSASSERPLQNTVGVKTEPRAGKLPYADQTLAKLEAEAAATTLPALTTPVVVPPVVATSIPAPPSVAVPGSVTENIDWAWPVKGNVLNTFTELNKGIDIAGVRGATVNAAAVGTVIHTGAGIRGYGRLVIIKHGTLWVSAYAHNEKIVVTEGQQVKQGQKIAEMGSSDTDQVKLHFEIRKQGKPVDPTKFLPAK